MTTNTQVAVLAPLRKDAGPRRRGAARASDRPVIRLVAFGALGLYGVVRWGTMMHPAPTWRLLGLLAVALVLAGLAPVLLERERTVAALQGRAEPLSVVGGPLALIAILAAFPIAGVPLEWTTHLRVSVTANGIGEGLSALPGILVPYNGINEWVRTVILLGAAVLLFDAALLLAFAPPALGDVRRAGAALPLIALVVVPATLVHPELPVPAGPAAVRAAGVLHVGRAGAVRPARRGAARLRGDGRDRDDRSPPRSTSTRRGSTTRR